MFGDRVIRSRKSSHMPRYAVALIVLAAIVIPSILFATQEERETEVRLSAYKHTDGRIEFAIQVNEGNRWSERIEPEVNILPSGARAERWYNSSSVTIAAAETTQRHMTAERAEVQSEPQSGHLGTLHEWRYLDATSRHAEDYHEVFRFRVEWSTLGNPRITVTSPDTDGAGCYGAVPCRFELSLSCDSRGLIVNVTQYWISNQRVLDRYDQGGWHGVDLGWASRRPTVDGRVTTSIDHSEFSDAWLIYVPEGQHHSHDNRYYGADFALEGTAAFAFLRQLTKQSSLTISIARPYASNVGETFDLTGAFDNPASTELLECKKER